MALETGDYISDLIITNPTGTDQRRQGDDHIRLLKKTITQTFPNANSPVTATPDELNILDGATVTTAELNQLNGVVLSGNNTGDEVAASQTEAGIIEIATAAEVEAGTDTVRAVTPATLSPLLAELAAPVMDVQEFATSGTWVKPSDIEDRLVLVELWGGGGSGGRNNDPYEAAAGGGGGGFSTYIFPLSELGSTVTVTVGAGGAARSSSDGDGYDGGSTYFGTHLLAGGGGGGGIANDTGTAVGGKGGTGSFPGGDGGNASHELDIAYPGDDVFHSGGGGGSYAYLKTAAGGVSFTGGNGGSGGETSVSGVSGSIPGGGGGGSGGSSSGAGARGHARITVF